MLNIKAFLANVTTYPGVYQMLADDGKVLYVGKARNLKKRLASYFSARQKDIKTAALLKHVADINVTVTHSEHDALLLECNLIKKYKPHYNILFRDDKSYPYILITEDKPYPGIDFYRGNRKMPGTYFGPYPSVTAVRETISLIQKLFGLRLCSDRYYVNRTRPCLQYQIGLCSGACASLISPDDYVQDVQNAILFLQGKNQEIMLALTQRMEQAASVLNYELAAKLRNQITKLREIQARHYVRTQQGNVDVIGFASVAGIACLQLLVIRGGRILGSRAYFPDMPTESTAEEILTSFIIQHYLNTQQEIPKEIFLDNKLPDYTLLTNVLSEYAQHKVILCHTLRGERKKWLEMANASAKQALASRIFNKATMQKRFQALQTFLKLKIPPTRIECFDISHSMGEATVGACIVFDNNGPVKKDYRRFNIVDVQAGDDVGAIAQALMRRYQRLQREKNHLPAIILIDGGRAQLAAAQHVLRELHIQEIILMGVAKGVTRKPGFETLHFTDRTPVHLPADSLCLHLIQQIRDEAHRFAITGHIRRRDKKRQTSLLESIAGIGAKRRRELLRYFGGIQAITRASLEELSKVPGISQSLAQKIFSALHDVTV